MPMDIEILQTSEIEFYCPQLKLNTGVENFFPHLIKIWVTPALDKEPKKHAIRLNLSHVHVYFKLKL